MVLAGRCEEATASALRDLGLTVEPYGQALLTERGREMLRGIPTEERWVADFLVTSTNHGAFLVDAKYSGTKTVNMAVEMRALLTAWAARGLSTYYVHSMKTGGQFKDFRVVSADTIRRRLTRGLIQVCCPTCRWLLTHTSDPMRELPEYCPRQVKSGNASGTPYIIAPPYALAPLTIQAFIADRQADG